MVKRRNNIDGRYRLYTLCYCLFMVPMLYILVKNQYILIGADDARTQHYPAMYYTGVWLREAITSLFQGNLQIPMIDFRIGMGDDIIYTLNYYGFGDPFYLLAALMKDEWIPYFNSILFYVRVYLGGMAFLLFTGKAFPCKDTLAYVTGAFLYIFSGFTILANTHVIFIHALMYIPLMLYGAECVLRGAGKDGLH